MGDTKRLNQNPIIFLVEPNLSLSSLIVGILARKGYQVIPTTHAEEAVAACRTHQRIDLLITEATLFGTNGIDVATLVRIVTPRSSASFCPLRMKAYCGTRACRGMRRL